MAGARNLASAHRADEHVALPLRELAARVERHPRDRDRGRPVDDRILEALARETLRLPWAWIRAAEAHERPAVVCAGFQHVDLVAAVRSVLVLPDRAGGGMHREPERAAVPERVDLGLVARLADERIVLRHRAVVAQAQHLAEVAVWLLRRVGHAAERRHIEHAVAAERETRDPTRLRRDEHVANVRERVAVPNAARDAERRRAGRGRLVVAEIHEVIRRELRMQRDVVQTGETLRLHLGHSRDRHRVERAVLVHAPQLPAALGHEHVAARQERDAPRPLEAARVDDRANVLPFRRVIDDGLVGQRRHGDAVRRDRYAVSHRHGLLGDGRHGDADERCERRGGHSDAHETPLFAATRRFFGRRSYAASGRAVRTAARVTKRTAGRRRL